MGHPEMDWWWELPAKERNLIAARHFPEGWQEQVDLVVQLLSPYGQSRGEVEAGLIRFWLEKANVLPPRRPTT